MKQRGCGRRYQFPFDRTGQERFTRLRSSTLGDGYDLKDIQAAIDGKRNIPGQTERKISLAVDIQQSWRLEKGRDMNGGQRYSI